MTIIVTGGAGFIGGNFIHYYFKEHPEDRVICIDKLTYAGNLSTLAPVMGNPNFHFCKVGHLRSGWRVCPLRGREARRWDQLCSRKPCGQEH